MMTTSFSSPDRTYECLRADAAMMRYASGDPAAFRELFGILEPRLRKQLRALCRSDELARELTQETFLRIHRARRSFRQGRAALPWVHAIARNLYRSHSRSWAHRLQRASVDAEQVPLHLEGARDAEAHAIAHQRARALHDAISELGEGPRRALLLRAQGHGTSAVARHLGVSEGAVKLRCFRTFRTLRRTLKRLE